MTMPSKKCYVLGCNSSEEDLPRPIFFYFPTDPEKCKQWISFTQNPMLADGNHNQAFICGKHFAEQQFNQSCRFKLKIKAVPTLHPPPNYQLLAQQNTPELVHEVLNEDQAQERILELMLEVDSLSKENVMLKKENSALKAAHELLTEDVTRLKASTYTILRKAKTNLCDDFMKHVRENEKLQAQMAVMAEELVAAKKQRNRFEEDLSIFISIQKAAEEEAAARAASEREQNSPPDVAESPTQSIANMADTNKQSLFMEINDIITDWTVDEEVEL